MSLCTGSRTAFHFNQWIRFSVSLRLPVFISLIPETTICVSITVVTAIWDWACLLIGMFCKLSCRLLSLIRQKEKSFQPQIFWTEHTENIDTTRYLECWSERMWLCKGRKLTINIEISWRLCRRHWSLRPTIASYCSITVKIRILIVIIWTIVFVTVTCLQKNELIIWAKNKPMDKNNQTFGKSVAYAWPFPFGWEETTSVPAKQITTQATVTWKNSYRSFLQYTPGNNRIYPVNQVVVLPLAHALTVTDEVVDPVTVRLVSSVGGDWKDYQHKIKKPLPTV